MLSPIVSVDTRMITSMDKLHTVFSESFGFPEFYGRNMNAWIDCMTSLDSPDDDMTSVHAPPGGVVVIQLEHAEEFVNQHPDLYQVIIESAAFVNFRRIETGEEPVLALSYEM